MEHIRTIQGAVAELRAADPNCAITAYNLRQLVEADLIAHRYAGSKCLVSMESIKRYFSLETITAEQNRCSNE